MAVVQKPTIKDPQDFISKAKTEKVKNTKTAKDELKQNVTPKMPDDSKKKNKRMTIYITDDMTDEMYLKWKEYEFTQLKLGKKISFQGTIENYLKRLLK
jgi:hypothetical protein